MSDMKNFLNEIEDNLRGIEDALAKILEIEKRVENKAKAKTVYEKQFDEKFLNPLAQLDKILTIKKPQPHAPLD